MPFHTGAATKVLLPCLCLLLQWSYCTKLSVTKAPNCVKTYFWVVIIILLQEKAKHLENWDYSLADRVRIWLPAASGLGNQTNPHRTLQRESLSPILQARLRPTSRPRGSKPDDDDVDNDDDDDDVQVISLELDTAPLLLFTLPVLLTGLGAVLGQLAAQSDTLAVEVFFTLTAMMSTLTLIMLMMLMMLMLLMMLMTPHVCLCESLSWH